MSRSLYRLIPILFLFSLCSCNGEPPCFNPPLLTDSGGLSGQVNLDIDALQVDDSRDALFSINGKFTGHVFGISGQTSLDASLAAHMDTAAPALALYGPRSNDGLFGRPIAQTCGTKGQESLLTALMLDRPGDYLIITADPAGAGGEYSLELTCNSGCDQPECDALVCDLYCPAGLVHDQNGCPICECAGCTTDEDCPRGFVCDGTTCHLPVDPCECENQPYEPVCDVDGNQYPNVCELECAGVEMAPDGVCPPGCTSSADCPPGAQCENGECVFVCDCEGQGYDPVCGTDGRTYFNLCELRCAGVDLAHEGECQQCNPEICDDGIDNDCDGVIDEDCGNVCQSDADCAVDEICWSGRCVGALACSSDADCPAGQECLNGICRGAVGCDPEICDGIDNDCDGQVDEGCPACRTDADCAAGQVCNTGTGECQLLCEDQDQDGFLGCQDDCDDLDSTVNPAAPEICDDKDNDCDGLLDEGFDFLNDRLNCGGCDMICAAGEGCLLGTCGPAGCTSDADCDDGNPMTEDHCVQGECSHTATCASDADCQAGQMCYSGICLGNGSCVSDSDCLAPDICEPNAGVCVRDCRVNTCPAGQYCHVGLCAP